MLTLLRKNRGEKVETVERQIAEYVAWRTNTYPTAAVNEERWLRIFVEHASIRNVCEVRLSHVRSFREYVVREFMTNYSEYAAMKAVGNFLGYYHARGYPCPGRGAWREGGKVV